MLYSMKQHTLFMMFSPVNYYFCIDCKPVEKILMHSSLSFTFKIAGFVFVTGLKLNPHKLFLEVKQINFLHCCHNLHVTFEFQNKFHASRRTHANHLTFVFS